jgi:hypothetical protein
MTIKDIKESIIFERPVWAEWRGGVEITFAVRMRVYCY